MGGGPSILTFSLTFGSLRRFSTAVNFVGLISSRERVDNARDMDTPIDLQPQELKEKMDRGDDLLLLDVREPWEHALASLPDSVLVPLGQLHNNLEEMDPDAEIVAYCHHGIRSLQAVAVLKTSGLKKVKHLAGGIDAWSRQVDPRVRRY